VIDLGWYTATLIIRVRGWPLYPCCISQPRPVHRFTTSPYYPRWVFGSNHLAATWGAERVGMCEICNRDRATRIECAAEGRTTHMQDAVVYLLAAVSHVTLVGCTDCIVVVGAAAASLKVRRQPQRLRLPVPCPHMLHLLTHPHLPTHACEGSRWPLCTGAQVELCERVHLVAAAARLRVASCRDSVFCVAVNTPPVVLGDCRHLQARGSPLSFDPPPPHHHLR
jgi:hypothetical protein